ncbi:MAG: ATP synthase F1 subunit epsilon [Myxococcota bacterium]
MATELRVEIVTPESSIFSGAAQEVVLPAWEGQMGVLPDHDALLSLLKSGLCEVIAGGTSRKWVIGRGFADIGTDHVTLLTDRAVPVDQLDKAGASAELAKATAEIDQHPLGSEAQKAAVVRAEWAQAILDA